MSLVSLHSTSTSIPESNSKPQLRILTFRLLARFLSSQSVLLARSLTSPIIKPPQASVGLERIMWTDNQV